jgi:hypothetical protein
MHQLCIKFCIFVYHGDFIHIILLIINSSSHPDILRKGVISDKFVNFECQAKIFIIAKMNMSGEASEMLSGFENVPFDGGLFHNYTVSITKLQVI